LLDDARTVAARRGLTLSFETRLTQPATPMDAVMTARLARAVAEGGTPVHHMASGAGHDAMVMARRMPAAMLFLRSPGGISHHPDESVLEHDVAAALDAGLRFLDVPATGRS
jgi:allantoate deiminase